MALSADDAASKRDQRDMADFLTESANRSARNAGCGRRRRLSRSPKLSAALTAGAPAPAAPGEAGAVVAREATIDYGADSVAITQGSGRVLDVGLLGGIQTMVSVRRLWGGDGL